ncbi:hypothetical protein [Xanthomonas euvesicatoria]|uniref:hypothetical protein n=1 Tax=Xanthomonas euvesicatoria TaxID=456327 RepID=UPI00062D608D|nr:hypothetical protein [Xanthomonas euvesicatoria]KLA49991.1 hypothetical protein XEUV685_21895 [Xanthomonas euvesicatoria]KLA54499.1 hypothetical protein XEUV684_19135 [Xanthomonas euvesicatoria]KLA54997.1 hypothetical protein XEUV683_05760 [Xanthomonas euvesicatoria]KLA62848.1 hypothetical protein XEUV695_21755 [Xanthomonas euvesicatoria]KLA63768.1 hypothetical protein XEUV689_19555 [Xanthomonas euvesicatoria]
MAVTIQITDPQTIALLQSYGEYLSEVDETSGTIDQMAEGLIIGLLDEHSHFRHWRRETCKEARAK